MGEADSAFKLVRPGTGRASRPFEIPRPAGKNAGLRNDADGSQEGRSARFPLRGLLSHGLDTLERKLQPVASPLRASDGLLNIEK